MSAGTSVAATTSQLEILRELKVRLLNHFATNKLQIETWPELFRITWKLYRDILVKKEAILPSEFKVGGSMLDKRLVINDLISTLEQVCAPEQIELTKTSDNKSSGHMRSDSKSLSPSMLILGSMGSVIKMHDKTRELINQVLKTSAPSLFQQLSLSSTDNSVDRATPTIPSVEGLDGLSDAVYQNLRIKINLFTINRNNWPILVTHAIAFLKEMSPPIPETRQREIACSILPKVIQSLKITDSTTVRRSSSTSSSPVSPTSPDLKSTSSLAQIESIVIPLINTILAIQNPLDADDTDGGVYTKGTFGTADDSSCKCCIIC
jgi:hypothetical protein